MFTPKLILHVVEYQQCWPKLQQKKFN